MGWEARSEKGEKGALNGGGEGEGRAAGIWRTKRSNRNQRNQPERMSKVGAGVHYLPAISIIITIIIIIIDNVVIASPVSIHQVDTLALAPSLPSHPLFFHADQAQAAS